MGILSANSSNATDNLRLLSYRVQTSLSGSVVPIVFGMNRVAGRVIWAGNFTSKPVSTGKGGKSSSKGGANNQSYDYSTDILIALCTGYTVDPLGVTHAIQGVQRLWSNSLEYQTNTTAEPITVASDGFGHGIVTPEQAALLLNVFGVSKRAPYSVTANDFGSPGSATFSGTQSVPMVRTASLPSAGQYRENVDGSITFNAADIGTQVVVTYSWYIIPGQSTSGSPIGSYNMEFHDGAFGQAPWAGLPPQYSLGYSGISYLAAYQLDLGTGGTLSNLSVEVIGLYCEQTSVNGVPIIGANPVNVINFILSDPEQGAGLGANLLGDQTQAYNWCRANSILISPVIDSQGKGAERLKEFFTCANTAPVWSDGLLKFRPYGDTTAVGNGVTFTPDTAPAYDLDDSDLVAESGSDTPIRISQKAIKDADNCIEVTFEDRLNSYNQVPWPVRAQWHISQYGLNRPGAQSLSGITDQTVAAQLADIALKNSIHKLNTTKYTLPWYYLLVEPMEMLTLTSGYQGLDKTPVRVVEISENDKHELEMTAEDFPWGTATATIHPRQTISAAGPGYFATPGDINPPIFVEAPKELTRGIGHVLLIALSGSANWGGCNIWMSRDDRDSYNIVGQSVGHCPTGVLRSAYGSRPDPDTADTLQVDVTQSLTEIAHYSQADADNFISLIVVDKELMAYSAASLATGGNGFKYDLSAYIRRGVYGTTINPHLSGAPFAALDGLEARIEYQPGDIGTTLWFKFTSFNKGGANEQDLADVTAYPYFITGDASRVPYGPNGGSEIPIAQDPIYSEPQFTLTPTAQALVDPSVQCGATIGALAPASIFSTAIASPVLDPVATVSASGGFISGPATVYLAFSAIDSALSTGKQTDKSNVIEVDIPSGTTASITVDFESWDAGSASLLLFASIVSPDGLRYIQNYTPPTLPATTLVVQFATPLSGAIQYPVPDGIFDHFVAKSTSVLLPGVWWGPLDSFSHTTTRNDFTFAGTSFVSGAFTNRALSRMRVSGAIPLQDWLITGNTGTVISTFRPPLTPNASTGDMMVVRMIPTTFTGLTIGDSALALTTDQYANTVLRAFYVDGSNQTARILSNDPTTFTLQTALNRGTPVWFWVEASSFGASSDGNSADISVYQNASAGAFVTIPNIVGFYAVQVFAADASNALSLADFSPMRDFYWPGAAGGGSAASDPDYQPLTMDGSNNINIDLSTSKPFYNFTLLLTAAMGDGGSPEATIATITPPTRTTGTIPAGLSFGVYFGQDSTGDHPPPLLDTGPGGFASDANDRIQGISGEAGLWTYVQFTFHGSKFGIDEINPGILLA